MPTPDQRRDRLLALDDNALDMLAVLAAAAGRGLVRSSFASVLAAAGVKAGTSQRQISAGFLQPLLVRWEAAGLTVGDAQPNYAHRCRDDVAHWVLLRAKQTGLLPRIASALEQLWPAGERTYWIDPERLYRDARLALYAGDRERALKAVRQADERAVERRSERPSLAQLFGWEAPAEALALLPPPMAERYVHDTLQRALCELAPIGAAAQELCRSVVPHAIGAAAEVLTQGAAVVALWRGDASGCRELAAGHAAQEVAIAEAMAALAEGDIDTARTQAATALESSRGPKKTRKPRITGPAEPYLALLLLTGPDPEQRAQAQSMLGARWPRDPSTREACRALTALALFLQNPGSASTTHRDAWISVDGWCGALFWGLYVVYAGEKTRLGPFADVTTVVRLRAREAGHGWLAGQFDELCAALESGPGATTFDSASLLGLYARRSPWERSLEALCAVARRSAQRRAPAADGASQRVLWRLSYPKAEDSDDDDFDFDDFDDFDDDDDGDSFEQELAWLARRTRHLQARAGLGLEARLQRRRGTGWTAGSAITLAKLKRAAGEGKLPAEDMRVCAHIHERAAHLGGLTWGPGAGLALVGHPRVLWHGEDTAAEIMRAEPTLVVEEHERELRLTMRPRPRDGEPFAYERDGSRLLVYALEPMHHEIHGALGTGVTLPLTARERLQESLGELTAVMPLQSEVTVRGGHAEEIAADPRPVLQLRRGGSGLLLRARVFPLGMRGPDFASGCGAATVAAHVDARALRAERDLAAERSLWAQLTARCPSLDSLEPEHLEVALPDLSSCYELLAELARLGEQDAVVTWPEGQPLSVVAERDLKDLKLRLSGRDDWLAAVGSLAVDGQRVLDLAALLALAEQKRGRFIELGDGKLLALSEQLRRRIEELGALGRRKRDGIELPPMALFALDGWIDGDSNVEVDRKVAQQLARLKEAQTLEPALPSTLKAQLRDYQREGFLWLCRLAHWGGGACLADDMGLGKTLQALTLLLHRGAEGPALVVAPTSVCGGWIAEATRFCPTLRLLRYGEGDRAAMLAGLGAHDVLIVSYGLLTQDAEALARVSFATAVLDEAQAIKNAATQRAKAAQRIAARCRIVTTGTPLENHLGEIWSQMNFLNPGLLGSFKHFEERFDRPMQRGDKNVAAHLRRLLRPFILRRSKAQVLDELPPKTEIVLRIEPGEDELAFYEAVRQRALARLDDGQPTSQLRMRLLGELMHLRRAACHPRLVAPDSTLGSAKLEALFGLVEDLREGGHKALVFSQFVGHLALVRERLDAAGIGYQYLDGSTPAKQRGQAVAAFQRGEGDLFLISLRAGGLGLNLTAADYVIHLDPWWNPAVEDQASDRAHRIGQQRPVTIYKLVTEGTIEERILTLHGDKRELAAQLLAGSETTTTLSVEQLRDLLRSA